MRASLQGDNLADTPGADVDGFLEMEPKQGIGDLGPPP